MSEGTNGKSMWVKSGDAQKNNALWRMPEWFPDTPSQVMEMLKGYHTELLKFNLRLNLVARTTEREADEVHFADCYQACKLITKAGLGSVVHDVGSGNGLPGIILGILNPNTAINLIESDNRKCEFLKHTANVLQLKNVKVMTVRLETLKAANIAVGVTRGFASLSKTMLLCNKIFGKGGRFFHLKSAAWSSEVADIPSQILSHWSPELLGEYSLPVSQARRGVIVTTKIA